MSDTGDMVPAEDILARRKDFIRCGGRWPKREPDNRLEPEAWPVLRPKFTFDDATTIFTIGSCFARSIEESLVKYGFRIPTLDFKVPTGPDGEWGARPNGVLNRYTPPSILNDLEWTLSVRSARNEDERRQALGEPLVALGKRVVDLDLAGYRPVSPERGLQRRQEVYELFEQAFRSEVVIITLGLIEAWWDAHRQRYIQQEPQPDLIAAHPGRFFLSVLTFSEAQAFAERTITTLLTHGNREARLLITTSPVPMKFTSSGQDALVANTHSKAVLRAICGELAARHAQVDYFPSFETIMLTKSPDIWEDDLIHVKEDFVERIMARFGQGYFPRRVCEVLRM